MWEDEWGFSGQLAKSAARIQRPTRRVFFQKRREMAFYLHSLPFCPLTMLPPSLPPSLSIKTMSDAAKRQEEKTKKSPLNLSTTSHKFGNMGQERGRDRWKSGVVKGYYYF